MKNYINEEEKKKQIEQMWEEYERVNKAYIQPTSQYHDVPDPIGYNENIEGELYEDFSEKRQHGNKRKNKGKQNKKKNKFSNSSDEDYN